MTLQQVQTGEVLDLLLGPTLRSAKTSTLAKTDHFELLRLVLPAGKKSSTHQVRGEACLQCLEGRVKCTAAGHSQELHAGQMMLLAQAEPHALEAVEDSSLLVVIQRVPKDDDDGRDVVQEASEQSFPASDPPAW